jgi:multidrug efflux pump subunit AcrA (membrane-fusion protein)
VPNAAVKSDTSGDYVQVLDAGGASVQRTDVTVGVSNDSYTEIKEGVTAGQSVVTQSSSSSSGSSGNRSGGNFMFGGGGMMGGGRN